MNNLIMYTADDGQARISLRLESDSIWLNQMEIAELNPDSVVKNSLTTAADGKNYHTQLYRLEKRFELYTKMTANKVCA